MGKRKDTSTEEDVNVVDTLGNSPHKKHKKHKHKKHKRRRERGPDGAGDADFDSGDNAEPSTAMKPALKLKIKIGGKGLGEKRWPNVNEVAKVVPESASDEELNVGGNEDGPIPPPSAPSVDSDISDEDAWLEALESGKLDEYDELKRMKDPALMTARQRALLESKTQRDGQLPELQMLPSGYKEKEMTEEMIQKRALRAKKRRQQAHEKREKDKKQTIDRLLKKHESKTKASRSKTSKKAEVPKITYLNNLDCITISLPTGFEFPLKRQEPKEPPPKKLNCGVTGCTNTMRYSCSKTGVPLCSLECYKENLASFESTSNIVRCN